MNNNSKNNFEQIQTDLPYESTAQYNMANGDNAETGGGVIASEPPDTVGNVDQEPAADTKPKVTTNGEVVDGAKSMVGSAVTGGVVGLVAAMVFKRRPVQFAMLGALVGVGFQWFQNSRKQKGNSNLMGGDNDAFAATGLGEKWGNVEGQKVGDTCYKKIGGRYIKGKRAADGDCLPLGETVGTAPRRRRRRPQRGISMVRW